MIFKVHHHSELLPDMQLVKLLGSSLYKKGYIIAGGSIWCAFRNIPLNDIDIFSTIKGQPCTIDVLTQSLREVGYTNVVYEPTPEVSKYATNYKVTINGITYKVQFINAEGKATGTPSDIIRNFDIENIALYINQRGNVASSGYAAAPRRSKVPVDEWLGNIRLTNKELSIGYVTNTHFTMDRVLKYQTRGLTVGISTIYKYLSTIETAKKSHMILKSMFEPKPPSKPTRRSLGIFDFSGTALIAADDHYDDFVGLNSVGFSVPTAITFNENFNKTMQQLLNKVHLEEDLRKILDREYLILRRLNETYKGGESSAT